MDGENLLQRPLALIAGLVFQFFFLSDSWGVYNRNIHGRPKTEPQIRVRVAESLKSVHISGNNITRKSFLNNRTRAFFGEKNITYNCEIFSNKRNANHAPLLLASLQADGGRISLKDEAFQGELQIVASKNHDSCDVINKVSIERYISSLLAKEMNKVWPIEALKAQAVAARTYAYHKMSSQQVSRHMGHDTHYDLENSEKHQVSGNDSDRSARTDIAATNTKGEILINASGDITPIFFHAKCGGRTLRPDQVWDDVVEGYTNVDCPYCQKQSKNGWSTQVSDERWMSLLKWSLKNGHTPGIDVTESKESIVAPDRPENSKLRLYLGKTMHLFPKIVLRKFFGRMIIPSNNFVVKQSVRGYEIEGTGLGHGVGLCQLGALDLAKRGWSYDRILSYYFPQHQLKKLY